MPVTKNNIKLILLIKNTSREGKRLKKMLRRFGRFIEPEWFYTTSDLVIGLLQPSRPHHDTIAILLVTDKEDLDEILRIKEFLSGFRLILILPDLTEESIAKCHVLMPRFFTDKDGDFRDLEAVLCKMLDINDRRQNKVL